MQSSTIHGIVSCFSVIFNSGSRGQQTDAIQGYRINYFIFSAFVEPAGLEHGEVLTLKCFHISHLQCKKLVLVKCIQFAPNKSAHPSPAKKGKK